MEAIRGIHQIKTPVGDVVFLDTKKQRQSALRIVCKQN